MTTPAHILDAIMSTVETAISRTPATGRAVFVSDELPGATPGRQLSAMILGREELCSVVAQAWRDMPPEALAGLRSTPSHLVPVVWIVGDHQGAMAYEPTRSVS